MSNRGYIGKISAIVTVNTADATRAFNKSAADAQRYGAGLKRTIEQATRDAGKSFDNIFTGFQKVQRALQASRGTNFNLGIDTKSIEQLALAAKQLAAPLAAATKQFDGLSFAAQRQFSPALADVQSELLRIRDTLQAGGTVGQDVFRQLAGDVERVTGSISRLNETANLTKKLLTLQDAQGLAFARPEVFDSINRLTEAQRGLSSLPAATRGSPAVRQLITDAQEAQAQINRITARIERLSSQGLNIRVSQAGLDAAVRRLDEIRQRTESLTRQQSQPQRTADNEIALLQRREQAAKELERQRLADSQRADDNEIALLQRRERAAKELENQRQADARRVADNEIALLQRREQAALELERRRQAESQRAADNEIALLQRREQASLELERRRQAEAQRTADNEIALLQRREQAAKELEIERQAGAQRAAEAASAFLPPVLQNESQLLSNQGARTDLGQNFGRNRLLEGIGGELDVIQRRLRELPGLAEQLGPPVDNVANRFRILARDGIAFTAEQARALRNDIAAVNSALDSRRNAADSFRSSFGGAGAPGLSLGVDARSLQGIGAQIELVQSRLAALGAEARGPVVAALDALRTRAAALFDAGTIDTTEGRRELQRLREEIIRTLAAADPSVSQGRLREVLARTGDVGRAGFDKFGLAVQQAAFVLDDFFSVTGGLDQRIRAIGNNVSQLGFVLGGTSGLVAGVAASITSQLVVALVRWANQNVETQDRVKVLNDALSRQKNIVEELAQAFRALGDSLTRGAFSPAAAQANEFRKELDEIIKKQKELRDARAADIDPTVQRERATQGSLQRRLEQEENIGRRIALQQQIEASRRRERDAASAAAARPAATGRQADAAIRQAGESLFDRLTRGQDVITPRDAAVIDEARARARAARDAQSPAAIRDALVQQRDALITSGFGESDNRVADSIRQLEELIASLEAPIQRANDALVISILEGAKKVSVALTQAQESIARADFGPSVISDRANEVAKQLESLARQLEAASDEKTINALREQQAALLRQSVVLESAARSVEQFAAALDRVAGQLADTVLQEVDGRAVQARRDANAAQGAAAAGAGNVPAFRRPQFERDQQRQADEAQGDRRRLEAEAERARAAQLDFERIQRQFVAGFERDATEGRLGPDAKRLIAQRNAATATLESATAPAFERQQAATDLAEAEAALASLFEQSDLARHLAELADGLDVAAQAAVELDRQIKEQRASANRGRELTLTPAEKAAEELNQRIADIREYANRAAEESTGLPEDVAKIRAEMNKAIGRAVEDAERAIAPMVFDLAEQVQNALMQGPSRAALAATDASTTQGQQELNRLLRGDDPARDQNLVELRRQTQLLQQIRDKPGAGVAN